MLKQEFGVDAALVKGSDGVFDVAADGRIVFSKHEAGRFPGHDEIIAAIRSA